MKKILKGKDFIMGMICGAVITALVVWLSLSREKELIHALCDGFFVSGALMLCYAGLVFSRNQGTFDIFSYGISHLFNIRWPGFSTMEEDHKKEKFADYRERVSAKRKFPMGTLVAAGVYAVIAVVMLVIYLNMN